MKRRKTKKGLARPRRVSYSTRATIMSRAWWERPLPGAEAFAGLCADVGDVVRCGPSGDEAGGGRGLFATAAVAKGTTIFRETPAVLVQDPRNRAETRACGCCHAMLGSSTCADTCAWGCGERYCDETCADTHVRELGHRVFCVGPLESWDHPVAALRLAAARDDDQDGLLALVQEMAARVLHEAHAAIANDDRQTRADADADAEDDVAAATAAASLAWFVRGGAGEGSPVAFESARCRAMSALVADAAAAAIADTENERFVAAEPRSDRTGGDDDGDDERRRENRAKTTARLRAVATRAFCARGVSALATLATRNQLSVVVRSDVRRTTYDGLALFPLTCLMNHGCAPNAETRFDDAVVADAVVADAVSKNAARASPPRARVVALRDVAAGEELTHAYVDVTRPAQVRAAALAGFGFKCDCEKCARAFGG